MLSSSQLLSLGFQRSSFTLPSCKTLRRKKRLLARRSAALSYVTQCYSDCLSIKLSHSMHLPEVRSAELQHREALGNTRGLPGTYPLKLVLLPAAR